jgi:hypothetical protein
MALTAAQRAAYDRFIAANPGDEARAAQALGFDAIDAPSDPETGAPLGAPPGYHWDSVEGKWVANAAPTPAPSGTTNNQPPPDPSRLPGGVNYSPEDAAVQNMINRDQGGWLATLKKFAADKGFGDPDKAAQEELDGMVRQLMYASNQTRAGNEGKSPLFLLGQAQERLTARAGQKPGSDKNIPGTNTPKPEDKPVSSVIVDTFPRVPGPTPTPNNTMANIVNTPTTPYSARAALPAAVTPFATQTAASTSMRPAAMTQPSTAFQPRAFQQTMQGILPQTGMNSMPSDPAAENAWNRTNAQYRQAGNAYMAAQGDQMGQPYNPSPWTGTRLGAPRTALGQPEAMGSPNDVALASEADRRRAYRFGQQNAQANQANAALGQQDFNGQMNNWLKAYNDWNNRGVDPTGGM